jgi:hypothetical protein
MIKLIGLPGAAGAGKDTVADFIDDIVAGGWENPHYVSFAHPLKQMVVQLLAHWDVSANAITDRVLKEQPIAGLGASPRKLMQTLGTEWGRKLISESIWIDTAERAIVQALRDGRMVVVTDVRFANEAELIHRHGGQVWRIDRPSAEPVAAHVSEQGLPAALVDRVIDNSGTLDELRAAVEFELRQQPLFGAAA